MYEGDLLGFMSKHRFTHLDLGCFLDLNLWTCHVSVENPHKSLCMRSQVTLWRHNSVMSPHHHISYFFGVHYKERHCWPRQRRTCWHEVTVTESNCWLSDPMWITLPNDSMTTVSTIKNIWGQHFPWSSLRSCHTRVRGHLVNLLSVGLFVKMCLWHIARNVSVLFSDSR